MGTTWHNDSKTALEHPTDPAFVRYPGQGKSRILRMYETPRFATKISEWNEPLPRSLPALERGERRYDSVASVLVLPSKKFQNWSLAVLTRCHENAPFPRWRDRVPHLKRDGCRSPCISFRLLVRCWLRKRGISFFQNAPPYIGVPESLAPNMTISSNCFQSAFLQGLPTHCDKSANRRRHRAWLSALGLHD